MTEYKNSFFIQKGSFCYCIVDKKTSNPEWKNKPEKYINETIIKNLFHQIETVVGMCGNPDAVDGLHQVCKRLKKILEQRNEI